MAFEVPIDVKLDQIKRDYVVSPYMKVSPQLKEWINGSSAVKLQLAEDLCTLGMMNRACLKDKRFGVHIYDDGTLRSTVRRLKGADASELFNEEVDIDEEEAAQGRFPVDVYKKAHGKTCLRLIALAYQERVLLLYMKCHFVRVIFSFLNEDDALFSRHKLELMHLIMRLQDEAEAFATQLPLQAPTVDEDLFRWQIDRMAALNDHIQGFMIHDVSPALERLQPQPQPQPQGV